jgi:type IV pilus assembly protein PilF
MSNQVNSTAHQRISLRLTVLALATLALAACATPAQQQRSNDAAAINTRLGIEYMRRGDLALAKEKLDKAVSQDSGSADVHAARAELFVRMGQNDDADSEFRRALGLAPRDPSIENSYAVFLCSHGRTDDGVKRFLEAARNPLYKTPEVAYSNAGVCLRVAKRDDEAALNFNRALQINSNYSEAAFQLATLQFERGQLPAARSQVDGYLANHEATADLLLLGVRVARAQGDRMGAVGYARRLQRDFAGSDQARALAALDHNPG